jgi:hypothetical protein
MSHDKKDKQKVREFLEQHGLEVDEHSKNELKEARTPDFKILKDGELVFHCEVKTIAEDTWIIDQVMNAPPGTIVGGPRNDATYNRISSKIHDAAEQFRSVNPEHKYPNVLIFIDHEEGLGYNGLLQTVTGYFFAQGGERHPIFKKYSEGRIEKEKYQIDLYLWFDDRRDKPDWLFGNNRPFVEALCRYFGIDPSTINCKT